MFDFFLLLKLAHILAAILMVGATVINGLIHAKARIALPTGASAMLSIVVAVNSYVMGPSLLVLPLTGGGMMWMQGYEFRTPWLLLSMAFSILLIVAFVFGARFENRLHMIAMSSTETGEIALPAQYGNIFQRTAPIGGAALLMSLAVLTLMVLKPF
jgi:uncharacterized membrane protein